MNMFKKFVTFAVNRKDLVQVIDRFATHWPTKVVGVGDNNRSYVISIKCNANSFQECLNAITGLSMIGVGIRKLNIKWRI